MRFAFIFFALFSTLSADYLSAYRANNCKLAYEEAAKRCDIDCNDAELNFIMATCAEKLHKNDEAIAAYERVLILDEDNIEAKLNLAGIYYNLGNPELMQNELEDLLQNSKLSTKQRAQINKMLESISDTQKNTRANISVGFGYDSNPMHTNDKYINDFTDANFNYQNTKLGGANSAIASFDIGYDVKTLDELQIGLDASVYNKTYFKNKTESYPDLAIFQLGVNPMYKFSDDKTINIGFSYSYVLLRRTNFLGGVNLNAQYSQMINQFYLAALGLNLEKSWYADNYLKDSNYITREFSLNNMFFVNDKILYLNLTKGYQRAKNPNLASDDSDYDYYTVSLGINYDLFSNVILGASASVQFNRYKFLNPIFDNPRRKDRNFDMQSNLEIRLNRHQSYLLNIAYQIENSNQNANDNKNLNASISYVHHF